MSNDNEKIDLQTNDRRKDLNSAIEELKRSDNYLLICTNNKEEHATLLIKMSPEQLGNSIAHLLEDNNEEPTLIWHVMAKLFQNRKSENSSYSRIRSVIEGIEVASTMFDNVTENEESK